MQWKTSPSEPDGATISLSGHEHLPINEVNLQLVYGLGVAAIWDLELFNQEFIS